MNLITLFVSISILHYVGFTIFCGKFIAFSLNDGIFYKISLVPQNIVMDLNSVMLVSSDFLLGYFSETSSWIC